LVVCGGDDSATNAALLAEAFLKDGVPTCVVAVPKTIDADLRRLPDIEMSFGFDTTAKLYAQLAANIAVDAAAAKTTWHFVRLMGRSASHLALEVALQVRSKRMGSPPIRVSLSLCVCVCVCACV
jgi:pyrophosphate--fructose-6-phosphate 1-phosphotransferase